MKPLTMLRRPRLPARLTLFAGAALLALAIAAPLTALAAPKASTTCDPKDIKCVIAFGDQRIQDRLGALTKLNGRVTDALSGKHITSDQANTLTGDIATNTTGLQNLKAKLDGESEMAAAHKREMNVGAHHLIDDVMSGLNEILNTFLLAHNTNITHEELLAML